MDEQASLGECVLTLRIRLNTDEPPTGVVVDQAGAGVQFTGWLDLMQTISRLVSEPPVQSLSPSLAAAPQSAQ